MNKLNTFQKVRELDKWQSIAFACTLLERMFPNWALFCEVSEEYQPDDAKKVVDLIWQSIYDKQCKFNLDVQLDNIAEQTPDSANYDMFGVYPAIDFCMSLTSTLQFIKSGEQADIVNVSKMSQGSVVAYLEAQQPEITNQQLKEHPLMCWEVDFQNELLIQLTKLTRNKQWVNELKAMALNEGCSNLGISV